MNGPSERHQAAIPRGVYRRGFQRMLRHRCGIELGAYPFYPDGFTVEPARRRITIYEIIVTHEIHEAKLLKIRALRSLLRDIGWMLRPIVGYRHGDMYPMDMRDGTAVIPRQAMRAAVNSLAAP